MGWPKRIRPPSLWMTCKRLPPQSRGRLAPRPLRPSWLSRNRMTPMRMMRMKSRPSRNGDQKGPKTWNNNYSSGPSRTGNRTRLGNNTNHNWKYCSYCKIQNHRQEECWKRILDNKPCKDKQGHAYWPKKLVYVMDKNDNKSESEQREEQQGFCS